MSAAFENYHDSARDNAGAHTPGKEIESSKLGQQGRKAAFILAVLATVPYLLYAFCIFLEPVESWFNHNSYWLQSVFHFWAFGLFAFSGFVTAALYLGFVHDYIQPGISRLKWVAVVFFGQTLPAVILWIFFMGSVFSSAFYDMLSADTLMTVLHSMLVWMIPVNNIWALNRVLKEDLSRPVLLGIVNGGALAASCLYSLLFLPVLFRSLGQIFYNFDFHFGLFTLPSLIFMLLCMIGPMTALLLSVYVCRKIYSLERSRSTEGLVSSIGLKSLVLSVFIMLAPGYPELVTRFAIHDAASNNDKSYIATRLMRAFGCQAELLRACYWSRQEQFHLLPLLLQMYSNDYRYQSGSVTRPEARRAFYKVTGCAFNQFPMPNKNATLSFWGMNDPDVAGTEVGGKVRGLALASSTMSSFTYEDTLSCRTEWTLEFSNESSRRQEARTLILLPPNGVVSNMKLWVNGKPKDAVFNSRRKVRAAYVSVVKKMQDPALVSTSGTDRVLLQCFPVPVKGKMKVQLQIAAPVSLQADDKARLRLPVLLLSNFSIKTKHKLTLHSLDRKGELKPDDSLEKELDSGALMSFYKDTEISFAPKSMVPNLMAGDGSSILQAVRKMKSAPLSELIVVVDCSTAMSSNFKELCRAIASLPNSVKARVILAHDSLTPKPLEAASNDELSRLLESKRPELAGGHNNVPALQKALMLNRISKEPSAVLWIHGPQPILLEEESVIVDRFALVSWGSDERIYEIDIHPGKNKISEALETASLPMPQLELIRPDSEQATMTDLFQSATGAKPVFEIKRVKATMIPSLRPPLNEKLRNSYLTAGALWAKDFIAEQTSFGSRGLACDTAVKYRVVTPVSGAVVLERSEQYKQAGLDESTGVSPYSSSESVIGASGSDKSRSTGSPSPSRGGFLNAVGGMSQQEAELELKKRDLEAKMSTVGRVVVVRSELPAGEVISEGLLEEKWIDVSRIPQDALTSSSLAVGRVAKFTFQKGMVISQHDLIVPKNLALRVKLAYAKRDVAPGEKIPADALLEKEVILNETIPEGVMPVSMVAGKLAKFGLIKDQLVTSEMVVTSKDNLPSLSDSTVKKKQSVPGALAYCMIVLSAILLLALAYLARMKEKPLLAGFLAVLGLGTLFLVLWIAQILADISTLLS